MTCPQCGADLAPSLLVCPDCNTLVHRDELKTLAAQAEAATAGGHLSDALASWRRALELLPPHSSQHAVIRQKMDGLVRQIDTPAISPKDQSKPKWAKSGGFLAVIALLLWKFKFLLVFVLTK